MDNKRTVLLAIIGVVAVFILIALSSSIFYTIDAGEKAVIFKKFGGGLDKDNVIGQGFNFKAPWNTLHVYDVKENSIEESMDVLDKNGLSINVDVTVRFHPIYDRIGFLHENFGTNYINTLVIPEVRSAVRQVMGRFTAEEIYSTKRAEV